MKADKATAHMIPDTLPEMTEYKSRDDYETLVDHLSDKIEDKFEDRASAAIRYGTADENEDPKSVVDMDTCSDISHDIVVNFVFNRDIPEALFVLESSNNDPQDYSWDGYDGDGSPHDTLQAMAFVVLLADVNSELGFHRDWPV